MDDKKEFTVEPFKTVELSPSLADYPGIESQAGELEKVGVKLVRNSIEVPKAVGKFDLQERAKLLSDNANLRARLAKYEDADGRLVGLSHELAELVGLVRYLAFRSGKHARPLIHAAALALESQAREIQRLKTMSAKS
jgi:hypothetical protein